MPRRQRNPSGVPLGSERDARSTGCRATHGSAQPTRQVDEQPLTLVTIAMTCPDARQTDATPASITVRTAVGQLRVISVWQALGKSASRATRTTVHCHPKHDFEEMTVTFGPVSPAELAAIADRLSALPWVVAASLHAARGVASRRSRSEADPAA